MDDRSIIKILKSDGIGILPTDTLYGIVGSAFSKQAVERIYAVRKRSGDKPFIVLIASVKDLEKFGVKNVQYPILHKMWVKNLGPISVILPCPSKKFEYLHRGTKSIAFRLPQNKALRDLLKKTGPLVAPSANLAGQPPAMTIAEAKKYFGPVRDRGSLRPLAVSNGVDFYISGRTKKIPSTLVSLLGSEVKILRQGAGKISSSF